MRGDRWREFWARARQAGRLMVGVPDYETYCRHMREHHPELPVMDQKAFIARAQESRFGGRKVGKCPC